MKPQRQNSLPLYSIKELELRKEKLQKKGMAQFKNDRITAWDQVQLKIKIKLGNIFL